jgi:hypothetical protein
VYDQFRRVVAPPISLHRDLQERSTTMDERYEPGTLGQLIELLIDGWQIESLHYAESCHFAADAPGAAAAFVELSRPDQGRYGVYIPDDGKGLSHKTFVSLFRERPDIWKHRTADRIHALAADQPMAHPREPSSWGKVVDPFPQGLAFGPATLRGVVALNQTQSTEDITISLTALERYQQGARLRYLAQAGDPKRRKQLERLDVTAVDDEGRTYRVAALEGRKDGSRHEGSVAIAPAIPREAEVLAVSFAPAVDGRRNHDQAPWRLLFAIQLAVPAPAPA